MANKKITDLTLTSLANSDDLFEKVNNPNGVPVSQSVNLTQIKYFITGDLNYTSPTYVNNSSGVLQTQINTLYPRTNPSGYITGFNSGIYITTGQTGQFYPRSNPSGFITSASTGNFVTEKSSITGIAFSNITINWSGANTFYYHLTGNTFFGFTGQTDGRTIVVAAKTTGGHTSSFPYGGATGVRWSNGTLPTQSTGSTYNTNVYTFINILGTIYGNVITAFSGGV